MTDNALAKGGSNQIDLARVLNKAQMAEIARVMSGNTPQERQKRADRFCRIVVTATRMTPKLLQCTAESFAGALMTCAQLDLEPNTPQGLAYLIPYYNNRRKAYECQFQVGYKGLLQLAYRSGLLQSINADVVYKREVEAGKFAYTKGITPTIRHDVDLLNLDLRKPGRDNPIIAAYASATLKGGQTLLRLVDSREIEQAKKSSSSADSSFSPWATHLEAMAMKTAIKRLAAWLPQTENIALAVEMDDRAERGESVIQERSVTERLTEAFTAPAAEYEPESNEMQPAPDAPLTEEELADLAIDAELTPEG